MMQPREPRALIAETEARRAWQRAAFEIYASRPPRELLLAAACAYHSAGRSAIATILEAVASADADEHALTVDGGPLPWARRTLERLGRSITLRAAGVVGHFGGAPASVPRTGTAPDADEGRAPSVAGGRSCEGAGP